MANFDINNEILESIVSFNATGGSELNMRLIPEERVAEMGIERGAVASPDATDTVLFGGAEPNTNSAAAQQAMHNAELFCTMFGMSSAEFANFDNVRNIFLHTQFYGESFSDGFGSRNFNPDAKYLLVNDYMMKIHDAVTAPQVAGKGFTYFDGTDFQALNYTQTPPQKPGLAKRILHFFNKNLFAEDFANYEQQRIIYERYNAGLSQQRSVVNEQNAEQAQSRSEQASAFAEKAQNAREFGGREAVTSLEQNATLRRSVAQKLANTNLFPAYIEDEIYFGNNENARVMARRELTPSQEERNVRYNRIGPAAGMLTMDRAASRTYLGRVAMMARGYSFEQVNGRNPALDAERRAAGQEVTRMLEAGDTTGLLRMFAAAEPQLASAKMPANLSTDGNVVLGMNELTPLTQDAVNFRQTLNLGRPSAKIAEARANLTPAENAALTHFQEMMQIGTTLGYNSSAITGNSASSAGIQTGLYVETGIYGINYSKVMIDFNAMQELRPAIEGKTLGEVSAAEITNATTAINGANQNFTPADHLRFENNLLNELDTLMPSAERVSVNVNGQGQNTNQNTKNNAKQRVNQAQKAQPRIMR